MASEREEMFCVTCGSDVQDNEDEEWHKDVGHKIIPKKEVLFDDDNRLYSNDATEDSRHESKKLYDIARSKIKRLVISQTNTDEVYAIIDNDGIIEAINLVSSRAIYWLNNLYIISVNTNRIRSNDFFKSVANAIIAYAQMNKTSKAKIYNRIAQVENEIWYDLGRQDRLAIKITSKGVEGKKLDIKSPIFRRSQSLQEQIMPKKDDPKALDGLCDLFHILRKERLVFKVGLACLFLESYPMPMIVVDGFAGSFKTTTTGGIKKIVDPSGGDIIDNVSTMAKKRDDLIIQLSNRYLSSFDNVSSITQETSDILCRAITGSSNPKRKLYTDDDESIQNFRRKIVLNGIVPNLEYPDLQTRLLRISRDVIDETNKMTEKEFNEKFKKLLPDVLGQLFLILHKALSWYKSVKYDIKPKTRMADFEVWGEIIARLMGYSKNEFLNAYYTKLEEETISSQESYPLVFAIDNLMQSKKLVEDTASNIYKELTDIAQNNGIDIFSKYVRFPKGSNKLRKHLKIVEPMLKQHLIFTEAYNYTKSDGKFTKNASIIKITRKESQTTLEFNKQPSPSSPSSPQKQTYSEGSEHSEGKY